MFGLYHNAKKKIKISEVKNFHIFLQLHLKLNYRAGKVGNLKTSHRKTYFQELKIKIPTRVVKI